MGLLEAVVLGLVQGLTEFLPISSTAHLRVVPELFGWPDPGAAYSAVIQLGTVAAVLLYFARDLGRLAVGFFSGLARRSPFGTPEARLAWAVLLGTLPIGVLGLALKKTIETSFRSLYVVASALVALALLLWWAEKTATHRRKLNQLTVKDGVLIGMAQATALIPGASRSGVTLTAGFALGLEREAAARFSFLLSIPSTALAGLWELRDLVHATDRPSNLALAVGTGVSFVSGIAAIAWLLHYLRTRTALIFVWYRIALGLLLFGLLAAGILKPRSGLSEASGPSPTAAVVPAGKQ
jgi:undecaprenyl-diphosphatase